MIEENYFSFREPGPQLPAFVDTLKQGDMQVDPTGLNFFASHALSSKQCSNNSNFNGKYLNFILDEDFKFNNSSKQFCNNNNNNNDYEDLNQFEDENLEELFKQQSSANYKHSFHDMLDNQTLYKQEDNLLTSYSKQSMFNVVKHDKKAISLNNNNNNNQQQLIFLSNKIEHQEMHFPLSLQSESNNECLNPIDEQELQDPTKAFFEFPSFNEILPTVQQNTTHQQENVDQLRLVENQKCENESEEGEQKQQIFCNKKDIWKIKNKAISQNNIFKKKKQRDYDKNICRYLARQVIRCFMDISYQQDGVKFCREYLNKNGNKYELQHKQCMELYESTSKFLLSKIEFITGHRAFRDILCFDENDEYKHEKAIFKNFTYWFLKERAFRYIMTGAMSNKKQYIKFKNQIMLLYVKNPDSWTANMKQTRRR